MRGLAQGGYHHNKLGVCLCMPPHSDYKEENVETPPDDRLAFGCLMRLADFGFCR